MSEPRSSPAAGPNAAREAAGSSRSQRTRWRDIQWFEFEAGAASAEFADAAEADGIDGAAPPPGVAADRAPRYGRAIAPLPPHLVGSLPPPPRLRPGSAAARHPARSMFGAGTVLRGASPRRRRGRRRGLRLAAIVLFGIAVGLVVYRDGDLVAGLAGERTLPPPLLPANPALLARAAATAAEPPKPRPAAAKPLPGSRIAALLVRAKAGDAASQYDLAVRYARGDGVARDDAAAATWFREAAIQGNVAAQYDLGVMYERGLGLVQDVNEALIWYHSAAAQHYPAAEYNLALTYADGRGTARDPIAAARWYLRAAEQGVVPAMINFAILAESGDGTVKSATTAYAWYRAAASRGDRQAGARAAELFRQFSADDKNTAAAEAAAVAASIQPPQPAVSAPSPASVPTDRPAGGAAIPHPGQAAG